MPGVYKRKSERDKKGGRWSCWWTGADGRRHTCAGLTDKAKSLEIANAREAEARLIREGLVDPGERARREASFRPVAAHVEDYRLELLARGGTAKHAKDAAFSLNRLLADAAITTVADLAPDRLQQALGRLEQKHSPRTSNKSLGFLKAFAVWLSHAGRIKEVPAGLAKIGPRNEKVGRKRVRRALTPAEFDRLCAVTEAEGPDVVTRRGPRKGDHKPRATMTGLDRSMAYQVAAGTGFRADEMRSLTPESFDLSEDDPAVTVAAAYSKRRRDDRQPVRRALAAKLRAYLDGRPPGVPVFPLPHRAAAMLADDLARAGIAPVVDGRVADFHSLRGCYVTGLVRSGMDVGQAQKLARHSDVRLTVQTYTTTTQADLRKALEGE